MTEIRGQKSEISNGTAFGIMGFALCSVLLAPCSAAEAQQPTKLARIGRLAIASHSAESARIVVRDRGIGVATEEQERIFGRFVRLAPTSQYGGFGLGLWIVRELAQAMGGSVRVESKLGAGATFIVELPRKR